MEKKIYFIAKNNSTNHAFFGHYTIPPHFGHEPHTWEVRFRTTKNSKIVFRDNDDDKYDIIMTFKDSSYIYFKDSPIKTKTPLKEDTLLIFKEENIYFGSNFYFS